MYIIFSVGWLQNIFFLLTDADSVVQHYLQTELRFFNILCFTVHLQHPVLRKQMLATLSSREKTLQRHSSLTACGYIHSGCNHIVPGDVYKRVKHAVLTMKLKLGQIS